MLICPVKCLTLKCLALNCLTRKFLTLNCLCLKCQLLKCLMLKCLALKWLMLKCLALNYLRLKCLLLKCFALKWVILNCLRLKCLLPRRLMLILACKQTLQALPLIVAIVDRSKCLNAFQDVLGTDKKISLLLQNLPPLATSPLLYSITKVCAARFGCQIFDA